MNEVDESFVSTKTRKRRRRSGFRYSSKKVLERSRVKRRASKVEGTQFESVTRVLSFPGEIGGTGHIDYAPGSSLPACLDSVDEHHGDRLEMSCEDAETDRGCIVKVSVFRML